ncbi:hypothetical protein [Bradyrhizobium tropiciagri]|uniref:hypothetical protein n=1 Tax=Bradyrhizobium tropiciagri TaxID=312253 RepID=UPI00067B6E1F|nr:hypothetical protein [Bradyrhizobium tropiciagri]
MLDDLRYTRIGPIPRNPLGAPQAILARANELYDELQGDPSRAARLKFDFLEPLLQRVEAKQVKQSV